ncbi:MAG: HDOD domain-containing protein [Ignavibacteriae bacterium]|nr:HDOD domain-containing protein [Ignavibacteriota bacterium]
MKISILFVDDEKDVIDGYKRMLFSMRKFWDQHFAISGEEALNILAGNNIDVIISDMKMPVMDGTVLLGKVKELYPHILRIILSGHQDEIKIIMTTTLAHQFLLKPCDTNKIKQVVENAFSMRNNLENEKLLSIINGIGQLPTIPELYLEIEELMKFPDVSLDKISKVISRDPSITAKLLQTVNSAFFGLPRRVTNILEALSFLGTNTIKSLILYLQSFTGRNLPAEAITYYENIGNHSLQVAMIAKEIGKYEKQDKQVLDDIYISGILHDIGKLILMQVPDYFGKMIELTTVKKLKSIEAESRLLGVTHEWAGAYLLGIWGLPSTVLEAIAYHHNPSKINTANFSALTAIHVANAFYYFKEESFTEKKPDLDFDYLKNLNLISNLENWWNSTKIYREPIHE